MKKFQLKELIKEEIKNILENQEENSEEKPEEKINTGEFNKKLKDFYEELRSNKAGINPIELQNILDVIKLLEEGSVIKLDETKRYELLIAFNKVRKEFRNEKLLILFILNFTFLDLETNLDNISFM